MYVYTYIHTCIHTILIIFMYIYILSNFTTLPKERIKILRYSQLI